VREVFFGLKTVFDSENIGLFNKTLENITRTELIAMKSKLSLD